MGKRLDTSLLTWMNRPTLATVGKNRIILSTDPFTDFWANHLRRQIRFNGHAALFPIRQNFTLTARVRAEFHAPYDQAGLFVMDDESDWGKVGLECRDGLSSSVCSTVTYGGFSDWAGMPVSSGIHHMTFRLHRRDNEFKAEFSFNGQRFKWLREFSLPLKEGVVRAGFYACSPGDSSFDAEFSDMMIDNLQWTEKRNQN